MMGCAEKMQRCHEYVEALEEERRKIQVFRRELPLCLELVTQAIETCKSQLSPATTTEIAQEQSECSEHTSGHRLVLEEFIPIKKMPAASEVSSGDQQSGADKKKSDWLRSAQLWNQSPDPIIEHEESVAVELKSSGGGAFKPFEKSNNVCVVGKTAPSDPAVAATSSSAETVTRKDKDKDKEGDAQRKQRRCWSPELHRRFLHALQQLGGSHTATPKQIRELMKVEGLTNDEVKSHLQKYRLHTKRPNSGIHTNQQAPQFLVVGGIWVPPSDYTSGTIPPSTNTIYAPVAGPPLPTVVPHTSSPGRRQPEERGSHSHSQSTSSSTHTTTASHMF